MARQKEPKKVISVNLFVWQINELIKIEKNGDNMQASIRRAVTNYLKKEKIKHPEKEREFDTITEDALVLNQTKNN